VAGAFSVFIQLIFDGEKHRTLPVVNGCREARKNGGDEKNGMRFA
jgi:hypothetical protein